MKTLSGTLVTCALLLAPMSSAQQQTAGTQPRSIDTTTVRLWEGRAPGALDDQDADTPTLTVFLPRGATPGGATAVIICPGGGYSNLAMNHEGRQVASYFNSMGVAAFVLKYRLGPRYHHPVEMNDGLRAVELVRSRAKEWGLNPQKIGIMGFSAGGHLASTVSTHFTAPSRPDFAILAYPVISMAEKWTHSGSRDSLLGANPSAELLNDLSNERRITKDTPPTFLFHTSDDPAVPVENSIQYYLALKKAGVSAELHVFQHGPHGVGLALDDPALAEWSRMLTNWLRAGSWIR